MLGSAPFALAGKNEFDKPTRRIPAYPCEVVQPFTVASLAGIGTRPNFVTFCRSRMEGHLDVGRPVDDRLAVVRTPSRREVIKRRDDIALRLHRTGHIGLSPCGLDTTVTSARATRAAALPALSVGYGPSLVDFSFDSWKHGLEYTATSRHRLTFTL